MNSRDLPSLALNSCLVSVLVVGMCMGPSGQALADTELGTITVKPCSISGQVPILSGNDYHCGEPTDALGYGPHNPGSGTGGGGGPIDSSDPPPTPAQQAHLEKCAAAYGEYKGHSGPKPGYTTKYSNKNGWFASTVGGVEVDWRATFTAAPPSGAPGCLGTGWKQNDGTTFPVNSSCNGGGVWPGNTTIIWRSAYKNDARMVEVLAHEWAHQWDADEAQALKAGDAAREAYLKDGGKKCQ